MSRKKRLVGVFLFSLVVGFSLFSSKPSTLIIASDGNIALENSSTPLGAIIVPDNYSTIQNAISNANAGDTIFVRSGTYYGSSSDNGIFIDKPLTLIGQNSQTTIIQGANYKYSRNVIAIAASNVTISGFTIKSSIATVGIGFEEGSQQNNITIIGNNILFTSWGIFIPKYENYTISKNFIETGIGITSSASNSVISDNNITGCSGNGIQISTCRNVTIKGNNISNNGYHTSPVNTLYGLAAVGGLSIGLDTSNVSVYYNNIVGNLGSGIQLANSCNNSSIYNNNIVGNSFGIELKNFELNTSDSAVISGNKVYNNNLINNTKNAFIENEYPYLSGDHEIYGNEGAIFGNGTDIVSWDNKEIGNFWSDYQSKYPNALEIDHTGIGNTSYIIDENNIDHYPIIHQLDIYAPMSSPKPETTPSMTPPAKSLIIAFGIIFVLIPVIIAFILYRRGRKTNK